MSIYKSVEIGPIGVEVYSTRPYKPYYRITPRFLNNTVKRLSLDIATGWVIYSITLAIDPLWKQRRKWTKTPTMSI